MICGHGPSKPIAAFITDGPQGEDLKTNYALSGAAGALLSSYCKEVQLDFGNFWRTCLIKEDLAVKPIKTKLEDYVSGNAALVEKYGKILDEEIKDLEINLLIPLGELAFEYVSNLHGIRKFRGSVLPPDGRFLQPLPNSKVLPILGPYPYLYNEYRMRFITRIDFQKIPRYFGNVPIPDNFYKVWVARTAAALREFFTRSFSLDRILVFDIETYYGIPTCMSFCFDGFESVCVPLLDPSIDLDNRTLMLDMIVKLMASDIRKVNQNIKYDWKILERFGITVRNVIGDTMHGANCLYSEFPKNLGFLTSIYTDIPYFKDEGGKGKKERQIDPASIKKDRYYLYNAKDSLACHQINAKQQKEIDEQGVRYVYDKTIQVMPVYRRMEDRGIRVDNLERELVYAKYWNLFEIEKLKLAKLTGLRGINPLSSAQMNDLVFNELGYQKVRGVKGTDEDSIALLKIFGNAKRAPSTGPAILDSIIAARKFHKVIEIAELEIYPDNRFRCEFNLAGTENARTSASHTTDRLFYIDDKQKINWVELGHSLQTIGKHGFVVDGETYGKDIRKMFVPSPGYRFVGCDLSGAEARVDAILAGITDLSYFDNPGIHRLTGSWCFDCDPSEIKKNVLVPFGSIFIDRYHVAKQVRHASERNISAAGLVTKLLWGFTVPQGEALLKKVGKKQPEIKEVFHKQIDLHVTKYHCLVAPNGRRRDFFDRPSNSQTNEAISFLPQAIVTDQTKFEGILPTFQSLDWAYLLAEAHDGSLSEVPIGSEERFGKEYKKNVEKAIDFRTCSLARDVLLKIPCEVEVGDNWYYMKEIEV